MYLSEKAIKEFKEIYEEEYHEKITYEEAELYAERLLDFLTLIFKPPKN